MIADEVLRSVHAREERAAKVDDRLLARMSPPGTDVEDGVIGEAATEEVPIEVIQCSAVGDRQVNDRLSIDKRIDVRQDPSRIRLPATPLSQRSVPA
jgi:hypothetical protein